MGALTPGDLVAGKYRIVRPLGEGGMGEVYAAINERLQKDVALKVLSPQIAGDPRLAQRFVREAMAASRAKHPGIVEIYDADVDGDVRWIAMELLEGEALEDRLVRGPVPVAMAVDLVGQTLRALEAVHAVGIVHRDLKPGNVFIERTPAGGERVKLLDFGIAKVSSEELDRMTRTGTAVGTPGYLAPEQAMGRPDVDHRADIYAVGVILYECLSGRLPYDAKSFGELVAKMLQEGPRPLLAVAPGVPPELAALADRCVAIDPAARPASAAAALTELEGRPSGYAPTHLAPAVPPAPASARVAPTVGAAPVGTPGPRVSAPTAPMLATPPVRGQLAAQTPVASVVPSSRGGALLPVIASASFALLLSGGAFAAYGLWSRAQPVSEPDAPAVAHGAAPESVAAPAPAAPVALSPSEIVASSVLPSRRSADQYAAHKAFDGQMRTAWNEGVAGPGDGEWIEARFATPMHVHEVRLATGWDLVQRDGTDLFTANAHARRVDLTVDGAPVGGCDVAPDQRRCTVSDLGATGRVVRLTFTRVYPGTRWEDLAIPDIEIRGRPAR